MYCENVSLRRGSVTSDEISDERVDQEYICVHIYIYYFEGDVDGFGGRTSRERARSIR